MEKIKEQPKIKENGEKKKLTKDEMIKQLEGETSGGIIVYDTDKVARTSRFLRFD